MDNYPPQKVERRFIVDRRDPNNIINISEERRKGERRNSNKLDDPYDILTQNNIELHEIYKELVSLTKELSEFGY